MVARVECDRCERSANLSVDEWDFLIGELPDCEYLPGVAYVRCTAWPTGWHGQGPPPGAEYPPGPPVPGELLVASRGPSRAGEHRPGPRHWLAATAVAVAVVVASYIESAGTYPTP